MPREHNKANKSDRLIIEYLISLLSEAVEYYDIKDVDTDPYGKRVHQAIRKHQALL